MHALETIVQPQEFRRTPSVPEWVCFPRLGAILGWGPGIFKALGWKTPQDRVCGLRQGVIFRGDRDFTLDEEINDFALWLDEQDRRNTRPLDMFLLLDSSGSTDFLYGYSLWRSMDGNRPFPDGQEFFLDADEDYRFLLARTGADCHVALQKRSKRLSDRCREKRLEFGLPVDQSEGLRRKGSDTRSDSEKNYGLWVTALKVEYIKTREPQLLADAAMRPQRFDFVRQRLLREREGEIKRGKKGLDGNLKVPYKETDLIVQACHDVARLEAVDLAFTYTWTDLYRHHPDGSIEPVG